MSDHTTERSQVPAPHSGYEPVPHEQQYHYPGYAYYGAEESEGADWRHMLALLWQRKLWIIAALLLGVGGGFLASRWVEPLYQSYTTVWVEDVERGSSSAIRPDEVLQGAGWASIFSSYAVMVPVAEELGLFVEPLQPEPAPEGLFADFELHDDLTPGVYEYRAGADGSWTLERVGSGVIQSGIGQEPVGEPAGFTWRPPTDLAVPGRPVRFRVATPRDAAIRVWDRLSVSYNDRSGLISARLTWPDPTQAAEILNALSAKFIEVATELKSRKMREEAEILEEQTEYVAEALDDAEMALESYRINTITLPSESNAVPSTGVGGVRDPVFGSYFDKRLTASQLQSDIQQIEGMVAELRAGGEPNAISLRMIPSLSQASQVSAALEELHQAEVDRRTLLYTYTEEFPQVQELTEKIRTLRQRTIPALLNEATGQLRQQLAVVEGQVDTQAAQLREIPSRSIEETRRRREAGLHAQLYNDLKVRLNNARLAQATAELADMQIVDEAVPPREPTQNEAPRIVLIASLGGLGIGIAGVLLHDRLDRRIRYPGQITKTLGLPVLGVVPELNGKKRISGPSAAIAIEAFRGIRTQLSRAGGAEGSLTMVTSPAPREGKSTVAANLAISYASAGYRTVLFDGDTRRGRAHEMFAKGRSPGFTDYLLERADLEEICQETAVDGLWLIARGSTRDFNTDRLDSERADELLAELRERYDAVVIDAPPLAAGADALLLGERADKCILVVRSGSTNEDLARTKLEMVGNVELHIVGTVLNAVPEDAPYYNHYVNYYYADAEIG